MNEQLRQICDAIGAWPENDPYYFLQLRWPMLDETRTVDFKTDDLKKLADYALRVEKMLEAAGCIEFALFDINRVSGGWATRPKGSRLIEDETHPDAPSAFEATQDVSNGRGTQG